MTDWRCSMCFGNKELTMLQASIICKECFDKMKETLKIDSQKLMEDMAKANEQQKKREDSDAYL